MTMPRTNSTAPQFWLYMRRKSKARGTPTISRWYLHKSYNTDSCQQVKTVCGASYQCKLPVQICQFKLPVQLPGTPGVDLANDLAK